MTSKKRTQYSGEFKAKVALAAIRGDETIPQLAARYGIHPTQINSWKRQLIEQAAELFSKSNNANKENGQTTDDLHRVIGQLTVERFFSQKARSLSAAERKMMIGRHDKLSRVRQCHLLGLARSTYYYQPQPVSDVDLVLLRKMDEQYLKTPRYGSRSYATWFLRQGILIGRKKAASLMKTMGIISTAPKPRTSIPAKQHKIYPYLLKGKGQ